MNKRLLDIAYYLYENDALGYSEAENLMLYGFGVDPCLEDVLELFEEMRKMHKKGVKCKPFPQVWNDPFIFSAG